MNPPSVSVFSVFKNIETIPIRSKQKPIKIIIIPIVISCCIYFKNKIIIYIDKMCFTHEYANCLNKKGISNIVMILLIAFTVIVGGILILWGSSLRRTQTPECINSRINITFAQQFCSDWFNATVVNSGSVDMENLTVLVYDVDGKIVELLPYNGSFPSGSAVRISGYVPTLGLMKKIEVYSPTCPGYKASKDLSYYAPDGMVFIFSLGGFCIDKYEASRSDATASSAGSSNIPKSAQGVIPWVNINQTEARAACARAGKHLCTNNEWQAATGTSPSNTACTKGNNYYGTDFTDSSVNCIADGKGDPTQSGSGCLTGSESVWCNSYGVCDLNGNVWEWVNETWFTSEPGSNSTVICWNTYSESDVDKLNHVCLAGWNVRGGNDFNYVANWNWTYNYPIKGSLNTTMGNDGFFAWCGGNATHYDCNGNIAPYGGWGATAATIYQRGVSRGGSRVDGVYAGCFAMSLIDAPSSSHDDLGFRCCL
jgi:hypothetical protein